MNAKRKRHRCSYEPLEGRRLLAIDSVVLPGLTFELAGSFQPAEDEIAATEYADLNGDGNRDLIYASSSSNGVAVALSQGNGQFASHAISPQLRQRIRHLHVADLNGDQTLDLIAAGQSTIYIMLGKTEAGQWADFEIGQTISATTNSIAVGDVDNDGNVDMLLAKSRAVVYAGNGDGTFANPIEYTNEATDRKATFGDMDNDGDLDIVTSDANGIQVLRNDGGIFEVQVDAIEERNNLHLLVGDANGDGTEDVWLSLGSAEHAFVGLVRGNGDGTLVRDVQKYETIGQPLDMKLADIDGDTRLDLVLGHDSTFHHPVNNNGPGGISILLAKESGAFHEAIRISTPQGRHVYVDDTNGDGTMDIVAAQSRSVNVYQQIANGLLPRESTAFGFGQSLGQVVRYAVADVNGDSQNDFVVSKYDFSAESGELELLLSTNGDDYLSRTMSLRSFTDSVKFANVDSDADLEIVAHTTDFNRSTFLVVNVDNQGQLQPAIESRLKSSWNIQGELDANGDGITDFVGTADGKTQLLLGSTTGQFTESIVSDGSGYRSPALVDFNQDGIVDMAFSDGDGFSVLLGVGDGAFRQSHRTDFRFPNIGVGDFNGDDIIDVVYTSFNSTGTRIIHGEGDGTFGRARQFELTQNSEFRVADFDNDGRSDLLFDSYQRIDIHLSRGDGFEAAGGVNMPHFVQHIASSDLDGDGQIEFIMTPGGASFSVAQAQVTVMRAVSLGEPIKLATTSFANSMTSPGIPQDIDADGVIDSLVAGSMDGFMVIDLPAATPNGDINDDGDTNLDDVDLLCQQLHANEATADLNGDLVVDQNDLDYLVEQLLGSAIGDVNGDGVFDSTDLVQIFQTGEYEDEVPGNSLWREGDWNCDGDFNTTDLVYAFQRGSYTTASMTPEPTFAPTRITGALVDQLFDTHNDDQRKKPRGILL